MYWKLGQYPAGLCLSRGLLDVVMKTEVKIGSYRLRRTDLIGRDLIRGALVDPVQHMIKLTESVGNVYEVRHTN